MEDQSRGQHRALSEQVPGASGPGEEGQSCPRRGGPFIHRPAGPRRGGSVDIVVSSSPAGAVRLPASLADGAQRGLRGGRPAQGHGREAGDEALPPPPHLLDDRGAGIRTQAPGWSGGFRCCSIDSHKVVVDPRDRSTGGPLLPQEEAGAPRAAPTKGSWIPPFPGTGNTRYNPGKLYWLISLPPAKSTRPSHCQINHLKTAPTIPRAKTFRDSPGPTGESGPLKYGSWIPLSPASSPKAVVFLVLGTVCFSTSEPLLPWVPLLRVPTLTV